MGVGPKEAAVPMPGGSAGLFQDVNVGVCWLIPNHFLRYLKVSTFLLDHRQLKKWGGEHCSVLASCVCIVFGYGSPTYEKA